MIWIAPSEEDAITDTLEKRLWDAAEQAVPAPMSGRKSQADSGGRPPGPVLGLIFLRFAERTAPLSDGILALQRQSQNLRWTRDLLLPRLLSRQVNFQENPHD